MVSGDLSGFSRSSIQGAGLPTGSYPVATSQGEGSYEMRQGFPREWKWVLRSSRIAGDTTHLVPNWNHL
ncbi:hypothetical protein LINPERHAP1_LOCUS8912 [Linum perenne]